MWQSGSGGNLPPPTTSSPVSAATASTSVGGPGTPYRPFETTFDADFRPNPFPSPEPPVAPPSSLSLSPPPPPTASSASAVAAVAAAAAAASAIGGPLVGANNNWSLSPPADDKASVVTVAAHGDLLDPVSFKSLNLNATKRIKGRKRVPRIKI